MQACLHVANCDLSSCLDWYLHFVCVSSWPISSSDPPFSHWLTPEWPDSLPLSSSLRLNMSCPSFLGQPCIPFFAFHIPCCQSRSLQCSLHPVHCPPPDLPKSHLHDPSTHCQESLHSGWGLMHSRMSGIQICYACVHLLVHRMQDYHFTIYWRYKLHYQSH